MTTHRMVQVAAPMHTTDEVAQDLARVTVAMVERLCQTYDPLAEVVVMHAGSARAIASWYASPRANPYLTALSQGRAAPAMGLVDEISALRDQVDSDDRYALDLLQRWVLRQVDGI